MIKISQLEINKNYSNSVLSKPKVEKQVNFAGNKPFVIANSIPSSEIFLGPFHVKIDKQNRIKHTSIQSKKLAKQAEEAVKQIKNIFENYLKEYHLDNTVEIFARPKSEYGITKKAKKETIEHCNKIDFQMKNLQNEAFSISDILPEKNSNTPTIFYTIKSQTRELLKKHSAEEPLTISKIQELIIPEKFKSTYGEQGAIFAKKVLKKANDIYNQKAVIALNSLDMKQNENITPHIRDAVGIRFIIKKPKEDLNKLPLLERIDAYEKYMKHQMNQITEMLVEVCQTTDAKMSEVVSYGGHNQYLRGENIQKLKEYLGATTDDKTLKNGYITNQLRMEMNFNNKNKKIPIKVELQIRGEDINKFAEVEHIPYDLREGKQIDLTKYNNEQRVLIYKIEKESRRIDKDEKLKTSYSDYLAKCYDYQFAKEYGVNFPVPELPAELDNVLSMESLFKLAHD